MEKSVGKIVQMPGFHWESRLFSMTGEIMPGIRKKYTKGIVVLALGSICTILLVLYFGLSYSKDREWGQNIICLQNLKQCAMATFIYVDDYDYYLPMSMGDAVESLEESDAGQRSQLIVCPCGGTFEYLAPKQAVRVTDILHTESYPLFVCPNVHYGHLNVAFADGHAGAVAPEEFERLMDTRK